MQRNHHNTDQNNKSAIALSANTLAAKAFFERKAKLSPRAASLLDAATATATPSSWVEHRQDDL